MGVLSGLVAVVGYGIATGVAHLAHRAGVPALVPPRRRQVARTLYPLAAVVGLVAILRGIAWQNEIRTSIGVPEQPAGTEALVIAAASVLAFSLFLGLGRGLRRLTIRTRRRLQVRLSPGLAGLAASLLVALLVAGVVLGAAGLGLQAIGVLYEDRNATTPDDVQPPTSALRSGGPGSAVPWDTIGYEGQAFIGGGPSAEQISAAMVGPAEETIRLYVGLDSADTPEQRAARAVEELQRTGAFERKVLVVAGVAGTGWLDRVAMDSLEYVWGGDTAIVASQYSYLPSWISVLVDQQRAQDEGRALVAAVQEEWSQLPADARPMLIIYGLSLGSYSIQAGFTSAQDMASQVDGAVLAGTPSISQPWKDITAARDPGSPQWQPMVDGGRTVRFADDPGDFAEPGPWSGPRIGFLQHADDPVVWWNGALMVSRPDWLAEPRGPAVSPDMVWVPGLTFLQVTIDQMLGVNQPDGFGHNYSGRMVGTWLAVTGEPDGWTDAKTERAQQAVLG